MQPETIVYPETARDPRKQPLPGDVLAGIGEDGIRRGVQVDTVGPEQVYCWKSDGPLRDETQKGFLVRLSREEWVKQAAFSEVLYAALGGAPVPDVCEAGQAYFNGEDL